MPGENKLRPRDLGVKLGLLPPGPANSITDVVGVTVGHVTLTSGEGNLEPGQGPVRTGVTVVLPHPGNLFKDKVEAAVHVVNGFGKAAGLAQIVELGVLETPIALTNTFGVAAALDGLLDYILELNPDIGVTTGTVNPVVGECNDAFLNDIRGRHVSRSHVLEAIRRAHSGVCEGDVGAGKGMVCFGYKGGIGTASRCTSGFTVGCLVLTNFGSKENLTIAGAPVGAELWRKEQKQAEAGDGSVIIVLATDAPLDSRQLGRLARRGGFGLARTGSVASHGSGDFVIAFSTTNRKPHYPQTMVYSSQLVHESGELLTGMFQAVTESVEEAVINSLFAANTVVGRDGNTARALPVNEVLSMLKWRD